MSQEEAFYLLVTSNEQGELSPLEVGIHALKAIPKSEGGRGKKGGLSAYAEKIGKTQPYISQVRAAAEVFKAVKPITQVMGLLDKFKHLSAIHKADSSLWPLLVKFMLGKGWSVTDTEHWVNGTH